ncbi:MAG: response regulator transcription factor [Chloroflexaceae bacterium]
MRQTGIIRLVSVDAQAIFRAGIRHICCTFPDIEIAGEAGRSADALTLCERLRPDLMLLDGALPGALSLVAQMRQQYPAIRIIILVDRVDESVLRRTLQLGVVGYLLKHVDAFDLVQAIRSAAGGLLTIDPDVATRAILTPNAGDTRDQEALSEREQAVLSLLLQGISNNAIAGRLQISPSTVKFHLRNIYSKLGVRSRAEALAVIYGQQHVATRPTSETSSELLQLPSLALAV